MGGAIVLNQEIRKISISNYSFSIKTASREYFSSKKFISSMHPANTLGMMDPALFRKSYSRRITGLKNTVSSFALYIVLKDGAFRYLDHNYYYHKPEDAPSEEHSMAWRETYMLHTPPPASEDGFAKSMIIMTSMPFSNFMKWQNTRTGDRGPGYLDFKTKCAESLLDLVEKKFPGIRQAVQFMEISTPLTWRDYTGTPEGAMYGIERDCHEPLGTTVLPATKIPGFYFTGQNINIHGVLGVTIGAVLTCGEILGQEYLLTKIKNS